MLQLGKCGEGNERRLTLPSLVAGNLFGELYDRHVLTAAGAVSVNIFHAPGKRLLFHGQDAGLRRDSRHAHVFLAGSDARLDDWIFPMGNRFDLYYRKLSRHVAGISRELRHGLSRVGVNVFPHPFSGHQLALDDKLRVGNGVLVNGPAFCHADRLFAERACDGQLIKTQRRCGRFEAGSDLNGRIHADADTDRQIHAFPFRLFPKCVQVTHPWGEKHGHLVRRLQAETVNGHIPFPRNRIGGVAHSHGDIRTGILLRILRGREKLPNIEALLRCIMDFLLARHVSACRKLRHNGIRGRVL